MCVCASPAHAHRTSLLNCCNSVSYALAHRLSPDCLEESGACAHGTQDKPFRMGNSQVVIQRVSIGDLSP